ncbi:unnamed protein product [Fraxinus pennsylvanica]|uniref:F-box domain-containing protein n=1 Tax=Fraxinus pennsylvanica TaxID=56036 RepID=A0AAD1ZP26_9LAMI|nr:unnamed protein product [Fraxinus pennsylvanica]
MDSSPLSLLPQDTLHQILSHLSLRQIATCKCVCKALSASLSSPPFLHLIADQSLPASLSLLALKPFDGHHLAPDSALDAFDLSENQWIRFSLSFLPFSSLHPITASHGLVYLWASPPPVLEPNNTPVPNSHKALVVCNPLTRQFKTLPQLGSAWSRHGSVLVGSANVVLVLTELAILYYCASNNNISNNNMNVNVVNNWLKFSSNLPSKTRSPILVLDFILTLCDVGTPWRSQWAMFKMKISDMEKTQQWDQVQKPEWGDVFDILKRPRLVKAGNEKKVYMVGGLKNSQALQSLCTTVLILKLDLENMEWEEAGRMPMDMYRRFLESTKFKVFGGGNRICFSAKKLEKLALWEENEEGRTEWRWIEGIPKDDDGLCRGFMFDARLDAAV